MNCFHYNIYRVFNVYQVSIQFFLFLFSMFYLFVDLNCFDFFLNFMKPFNFYVQLTRFDSALHADTRGNTLDKYNYGSPKLTLTNRCKNPVSPRSVGRVLVTLSVQGMDESTGKRGDFNSRQQCVRFKIMDIPLFENNEIFRMNIRNADSVINLLSTLIIYRLLCRKKDSNLLIGK